MVVQTATHPVSPGSRVAVIGAGIAGLASAYLLARRLVTWAATPIPSTSNWMA
jgi:cation diffusion facilitator CzcD-associated flavoprotein CzcO